MIWKINKFKDFCDDFIRIYIYIYIYNTRKRIYYTIKKAAELCEIEVLLTQQDRVTAEDLRLVVQLIVILFRELGFKSCV